MVHRLLNLCDLTKSVNREMHPLVHHLEDSLELQEILAFRRSQWIRFEEGNHDSTEVMPSVHVVRQQVLFVVVVSFVSPYSAASEVVPDEFQCRSTLLTLDYRKAWLHLPPSAHALVALDWATEATLTVDEANDPLLDSWPFLLIVRTGRIVTAIHVTNLLIRCDKKLMTSTAGYTGFPAFSRVVV